MTRRRRMRRNKARKTRRKTYRNSRPTQRGGLVALKQRGGLGQAYQIPPWAVVSASFQEPDNGYPVLMSYAEYRESLDNPIFDQEEPEKLNQPSPEKPGTKLEQNAEHAGREEVQVEQALSGVKGSPSPRRRRSANRSRYKGPR